MGLRTLLAELFSGMLFTLYETFAWHIRVAWLVYVRTYCVPIAILTQNNRSRLLFLGDAQVITVGSYARCDYFVSIDDALKRVTMLRDAKWEWAEKNKTLYRGKR